MRLSKATGAKTCRQCPKIDYSAQFMLVLYICTYGYFLLYLLAYRAAFKHVRFLLVLPFMWRCSSAYSTSLRSVHRAITNHGSFAMETLENLELLSLVSKITTEISNHLDM